MLRGGIERSLALVHASRPHGTGRERKMRVATARAPAAAVPPGQRERLGDAPGLGPLSAVLSSTAHCPRTGQEGWAGNSSVSLHRGPVRTGADGPAAPLSSWDSGGRRGAGAAPTPWDPGRGRSPPRTAPDRGGLTGSRIDR